MMQNGEQSITHCLNCKTQFVEPQKIGDWIYCDTCEETLRLSTKPKSKPKEDE